MKSLSILLPVLIVTGCSSGEGNEAIPNIARRKHLALVTQAARAAAIVRHCHERRQIGEIDIVFVLARQRWVDVVLEARQQRGKTGTAANDEDPEAVDVVVGPLPERGPFLSGPPGYVVYHRIPARPVFPGRVQLGAGAAVEPDQ